MRRITIDGSRAGSEEFFRVLVENSLDLIMVADAGGKPLYVNPVHERVLGYTAEEFVELKVPDLLHPDDYERVMSGIAENMADPEAITGPVEGRYRHKDGSWVWIEGIALNTTEEPAVGGILYCGRDITERKRVQERERFLSLLVENSLDPVSVVNPDFTLRYTSPSIERILDYTPEEFTAFMPSDIIHPDDLEGMMSDMAEAADNPGVNPVGQYRIRHKDGSWRWFEAIANNLFHDPSVEALVVNIRDVTERKRLEERLRFLSLLTESSLDLVSVINPNYTLSYVSPSIKRILGWTPEEALAFAPSDSIHPDDLQGVMSDMAEAADNPGINLTGQYRYRHKDGSWRWLEGIANNLLDDPVVGALVANLRDITERKRLEEELRFLSLLTENSTDMVLVADADGTARYASPSVERVLGYEPEEMLGMKPLDLLHPDDAEQLMPDWAEIADDPGISRPTLGRYRHKDGSWRWIEGIANNLLDHPGVMGIVAVGRDVTKRKEAEEEIVRLNEILERRVAERTAELRESEEQFRAAFEVAAVGMAQVNTNGRYLRVNPKFCEIAGYTGEELLARTFQEITHTDDLDAELEYVQEMLSGEIETYSIEKRYVRKDRTRVWVNLVVSLARGPSGEPRYFIQVAEDVTKRKDAQYVLQKLTSGEVEVLEHLALGKTNPKIAASTSFSLGTVKLHVREILHKLGVSDRTQATARAVELGLVSSRQKTPESGRRRREVRRI